MRRQRPQVVDAMIGHDVAAERPELGDQRVSDGLRATLDHRPADRVRERAQRQPERGRQRAIQPQHRVRGDAGEQGSSRLVVEPATREALGGPQRRQPEARHRQRVARHMDDRSEEFPGERFVTTDERPEQPTPGAPVLRPQGVGGRRDRALEDRGSSAVQRLGERRVWLQELHAMRGEIHRCGRTATRAREAGSSSRRRGGSRAA